VLESSRCRFNSRRGLRRERTARGKSEVKLAPPRSRGRHRQRAGIRRRTDSAPAEGVSSSASFRSPPRLYRRTSTRNPSRPVAPRWRRSGRARQGRTIRPLRSMDPRTPLHRRVTGAPRSPAEPAPRVDPTAAVRTWRRRRQRAPLRGFPGPADGGSGVSGPKGMGSPSAARPRWTHPRAPRRERMRCR